MIIIAMVISIHTHIHMCVWVRVYNQGYYYHIFFFFSYQILEIKPTVCIILETESLVILNNFMPNKTASKIYE